MAADPVEPPAFTSFLADHPPTVYSEPLAVGHAVPDVPLFLDPRHYITVPLAATYEEAFGGFPQEERDRLNASLGQSDDG